MRMAGQFQICQRNRFFHWPKALENTALDYLQRLGG